MEAFIRYGIVFKGMTWSKRKINGCGYQYKVLLYVGLNWIWIRTNHPDYESLDSCPLNNCKPLVSFREWSGMARFEFYNEDSEARMGTR